MSVVASVAPDESFSTLFQRFAHRWRTIYCYWFALNAVKTARLADSRVNQPVATITITDASVATVDGVLRSSLTWKLHTRGPLLHLLIPLDLCFTASWLVFYVPPLCIASPSAYFTSPLCFVLCTAIICFFLPPFSLPSLFFCCWFLLKIKSTLTLSLLFLRHTLLLGPVPCLPRHVEKLVSSHLLQCCRYTICRGYKAPRVCQPAPLCKPLRYVKATQVRARYFRAPIFSHKCCLQAFSHFRLLSVRVAVLATSSIYPILCTCSELMKGTPLLSFMVTACYCLYITEYGFEASHKFPYLGFRHPPTQRSCQHCIAKLLFTRPVVHAEFSFIRRQSG